MKIAFTFDVELGMDDMKGFNETEDKNRLRDRIVRETIKKETQDEFIESFKIFTGFENVKLDIEIEGEL